MWFYFYRLSFGIIFAFLLWFTTLVKAPDGTFPAYYYAVILLGYGAHQVALYSMFVAIMAFHARISDPAIGGTYMTLLNTITNLGGNWPATLTLWLVDPFTRKSCSNEGHSCSDSAAQSLCEANGGKCSTDVDGYYVVLSVSLLIGLLWLKWGRSKLLRLQSLPLSTWKCANVN